MARFSFKRSKPIHIGNTHTMEEVYEAVRVEIALVESGEKSARDALRHLLRTYKVLTKEAHGSAGKHALLPLIEPYVKETLKLNS